MYKTIYILNHKDPEPSEEKGEVGILWVRYNKKQRHLRELVRFLEQKVILSF